MLGHDEGLERTEQPTQKRRDEAREQGQFAFSHEMANALVMLAGAAAVFWAGRGMIQSLRGDLEMRLRWMPTELTLDHAAALINGLFGRALELAGAIMGGLLVVGVGANVAQAGWHISTESLGPKWEKLNPVTGWQRIMSLAGVARGMFALAKVAAISTIVWWMLRGRDGQVAALASGSLSEGVATAWDISIRLVLAVAGALVVIGVADYGVQWWRNEKALRMSKQEIKDEHKEDEGDPKLKAMRRGRARELAMQRRMIAEVPKATTIITNPTHIAIALRYERGVTSAPVVIAKGKDAFALQIVAKARRHGVPVVERKPLARALFKLVKVGQEIPQELYLAVSEVLAFVYRMRGVA